MAYDKVVDSAALEAALKASADAIRGKTGGADYIPWDAVKGFADAIAAIEAGGGSGGGLDISGFDVAGGMFVPATSVAKPVIDTGWGVGPDATKKLGICCFGWQPEGVANYGRNVTFMEIYNMNINGSIQHFKNYSYASSSATKLSESGVEGKAVNVSGNNCHFNDDGTISLVGYTGSWKFAAGHIYVWFALKER